MIELYEPEWFEIHELVPKQVYEDRGDKAIELIDVRVWITLDQLRAAYGPITINNWYWGGSRQWSGLRTADSPYGSEYSQHRFGRAADCLIKGINADIVRQDILKNPDRFPYIMALEMGVSWLHFDVRNCDRITKFYP